MERMIGAIFLAAVLLTALVLSVKTYNGLIVLRSFCAEGWSGVLAAVRRRRAAIVQALRAMAPGCHRLRLGAVLLTHSLDRKSVV